MIKHALAIALAAAFSFTIITPAHAAAPTIAIVDVEKILAEATAAKSLQKQIQTKKEAFQKEFADKEKELKNTEVSLLAEKEKLSAEEFGKKRKAYEEKILATRKLFQKRRNALDQGLAGAMQELRKNIVQSTTEVAEDKKYDIVLTRESVLIAEKALDITDDVLTKLNSKLTDVKLKVE